ncbi:mucin-17-like isoform X1 [Sycon ciliatum]|uniref:mucin-17-like isoform X1 n=1 Tax=Sycon ciliatum TaxID=27933 RepID=UPI0031F60052
MGALGKMNVVATLLLFSLAIACQCLPAFGATLSANATSVTVSFPAAQSCAILSSVASNDTHMESCSDTQVTFSGLRAYTRYMVLSWKAGDSTQKTHFINTTAAAPGAVILDVVQQRCCLPNAMKKNESSWYLYVSWKPLNARDWNGKPIDFSLWLYEDDNKIDTFIADASKISHSFVVQDIKDNVTLTATIDAYSSGGAGPEVNASVPWYILPAVPSPVSTKPPTTMAPTTTPMASTMSATTTPKPQDTSVFVSVDSTTASDETSAQPSPADSTATPQTPVANLSVTFTTATVALVAWQPWLAANDARVYVVLACPTASATSGNSNGQAINCTRHRIPAGTKQISISGLAKNVNTTFVVRAIEASKFNSASDEELLEAASGYMLKYIPSTDTEPPSENDSVVLPVVGGVCGALALSMIIAIIVVFRKRQLSAKADIQKPRSLPFASGTLLNDAVMDDLGAADKETKRRISTATMTVNMNDLANAENLYDTMGEESAQDPAMKPLPTIVAATVDGDLGGMDAGRDQEEDIYDGVSVFSAAVAGGENASTADAPDRSNSRPDGERANVQDDYESVNDLLSRQPSALNNRSQASSGSMIRRADGGSIVRKAGGGSMIRKAGGGSMRSNVNSDGRWSSSPSQGQKTTVLLNDVTTALSGQQRSQSPNEFYSPIPTAMDGSLRALPQDNTNSGRSTESPKPSDDTKSQSSIDYSIPNRVTIPIPGERPVPLPKITRNKSLPAEVEDIYDAVGGISLGAEAV